MLNKKSIMNTKNIKVVDNNSKISCVKQTFNNIGKYIIYR